ncbi:MAG TPA: citrate/2-methylcitrate synthase [Nitrospiraceae bacterium]|nr:citrate/2-methylcitrate synthase [Nitrospiraceae bacterium]
MGAAIRESPARDGSHPSYSPGLEGIIAGESALCLVDEGESGLLYRGYGIADLAEHSTFEEVAYLLLFGHLPTRQELKDFGRQITDQSLLPRPVEAFLEVMPQGSHAMDVLRTGVSILGMSDPEAGDHSEDANRRKSVRLLAQIPLLLSAADRISSGAPFVCRHPALSFAENLLYLLTGRKGDARATAMARVLDVSLTLYAEHEFNASTFSARVTASTMTDLHSAITSAVGTLKGPLHGGANEAVAQMFVEIGSPDNAERWVREALMRKHRIMGFGHRVLKNGDARSAIIQRHAAALSRSCDDDRWYGIATTLEHVMREEKGLYPNLDFYTAVAYLLMAIPRTLYTPVFVCSRITGWCAHVVEQQSHNRLMRPRALYSGPSKKEYVPLDRRA